MPKDLKRWSHKEIIHFLLLATVLLSIPFSSAVNSISFAAYICFVLVFLRNTASWKTNNLLIILALGCFFILTIVDFRSIDKEYFEFILRISPLIISPFVFVHIKDTSFNLRHLTVLLSISSLAAVFLGIFKAFEYYNRPEEHFRLIHLPHVLNGKYHSVYFAIQLGINAILAFTIYLKEKATKFLWFSVFCVIVIVLLGKRMALLSLFILGLIFLLSSQRRRAGFFYFLSIIILPAFFLLLPYNRWRLMEWSRLGEGSERLTVYRASFDVLREHLFFGVGSQNVFEELGSKYLNYGLSTPFFANNPHSQLVYVSLAFGLVGLLLYLFTQFILIFNAIRTDKSEFLAVYIFLFLTGLTETILIRQQGVMLYSLVLSFLLFGRINRKL